MASQEKQLMYHRMYHHHQHITINTVNANYRFSTSPVDYVIENKEISLKPRNLDHFVGFQPRSPGVAGVGASPVRPNFPPPKRASNGL